MAALAWSWSSARRLKNVTNVIVIACFTTHGIAPEGRTSLKTRPRNACFDTAPTQPSNTLAVVPNPHPDRDYEVVMTVPEFTCLCPMTGQPDFATIRIRYVPDQLLVELKSLKLYLWSYRQEGAFHEAVTNRILDDFVRACSPREAVVTAEFSARGGIALTVRAEFPDGK